MEEADAQKATEAGPGRRPPGWWRPVALLGLAAAIFVTLQFTGVGDRLGGLRAWIGRQGALAPAVFVLIRAAAAVAVVPGSPLSMAAGWLFGPVVGVACISAGKTLGAAAAFLIARYFARDDVERWLAAKPQYRRLDDLVADHGVLIVALNRLCPLIPFNLQNYAFGLTRMRFSSYLLWSWLCMLPWAVFVVVAMKIVEGVTPGGEMPWGLIGVLAADVAVICVAILIVFVRILAGWKRRRGAL